MYVPQSFAMSAPEVRELLDRHGAGDLVTATPDGLLATLVPFVFDPSVGESGRAARAPGPQQRPVAAARRWARRW
jgi:transcriptional regulator